MTTDYRDIYRTRAGEYHRLVSAEDADGALRRAILGVTPLAGRSVVEVGVGTGRVTEILIGAGIGRLVGVDVSAAMLEMAMRTLERLNVSSGCDLRLCVGDAERLPVAGGFADLAIAGWVFGHATHWFPDSWKAHVDAALGECARATRKGAFHIVIETLGTGAESPAPPNAGLAAYYAHLEGVHGFRRVELRTDYAFASPEIAAETCRLFFGDAFADEILRRRWSRVPECTGLWWRERPETP